MEKDKFGIVGKIVSLSFVLVLFVLLLRRGEKRHENLVANAYLVNGYIIKESTGSKSVSLSFKFEYEFKGKKYVNFSYPYAYVINLSSVRQLVGKSFPTVVDSTNPTRADILLIPRKFVEYGIPYPDSLEWVKSLVK